MYGVQKKKATKLMVDLLNAVPPHLIIEDVACILSFRVGSLCRISPHKRHHRMPVRKEKDLEADDGKICR